MRRGFLSDADLAQIIADLPASPRLLAELAPKLHQVEVPVPEITEVLRRDPGLTARLIAFANSPVYGRAEPAISLEEAVACIGYAEVYRLIGALAATDVADEPLRLYGIDTRRFRENALFVALVMEELAGATGAEPRSAYTIGLLRSIGKVALDRRGRRAGRDPAVLPDGVALLEWETAQWGGTNADVAAQILTQWRFPENTVQAVRDHYAPEASSVTMSHLLNICAGAADVRGFGFRGEDAYWQFTPENFARTGIDEGRLVWAGERAFRALQRISAVLA